jgi:hypothetical protein
MELRRRRRLRSDALERVLEVVLPMSTHHSRGAGAKSPGLHAPPLGGRARWWLQATTLAAVTLVVYAPARRAGFVVDDFALLLENPVIAARDGLFQIWFSTTQSDYFPLTLTSFWG